jgi:hypothetical protein
MEAFPPLTLIIDAVSTLFSLLRLLELPGGAVLLDALVPLAAVLLGDRGVSLVVSATDKVVESVDALAFATAVEALAFLFVTGMTTSVTTSFFPAALVFGFGDAVDSAADDDGSF